MNPIFPSWTLNIYGLFLLVGLRRRGGVVVLIIMPFMGVKLSCGCTGVLVSNLWCFSLNHNYLENLYRDNAISFIRHYKNYFTRISTEQHFSGTFFCSQAQFKLASSLPVQLGTEIESYYHCWTIHPPTHPGNVTSTYPRKLKFGMQAKFTIIRWYKVFWTAFH